ncbi:ScyD/ScyE family protein [Desertihabitans brevis]|uniref:ScyD/ScyE family protein n=1 Tax=Desertihabitans brevis TaxID=2268447 RepID=A0A367YSE1_9ACTN|nr:ScyD/ScyE family protein [Desertihabitans brevis]RCK68738.1 ScyD/ScyE family protein [Desertihabitans brevis]
MPALVPDPATVRRHVLPGALRAGAVGLAVAALTLASAPVPASADRGPRHSDPVTVVAEGLDGPRQISPWGGRLLVAESDSGEVSLVNPSNGRSRVVVDGLATPQGVVEHRGRVYVATGEAGPEAGDAEGSSAVLVARPGREPRVFADLLEHELEENPDGQTQFGPDGAPLDALSNPYFLLEDRRRHGFLLVADAGANAVLAVDGRGRVSTFFVPPTVTTGPCAELPNNNATGVGCDSVPTGLAYGPDGLLHVSALTAEAPGEGRVWVVDSRGRVVRSHTGFTAPTGVAVDHDGTVYVSELLEGAPAGPPPPEADPADIGRIVALAPDGTRSVAEVTMPSGLLHHRGTLWSAAWAIGGFLGRPGAGQVVKVSDDAFTPLAD